MNEAYLIDYCIVLAFLLLTLFIGIHSGKNITNVSGYALSKDKPLPFSIIVITMIATITGGNTTMGASAEFFKDGVIYGLSECGFLIAVLVFAKWIAPKFDDRFEGAFSSADIMSKFYGESSGKFSALTLSFVMMILIALQITMLGRTISYFTGIDLKLCSLVSGAVLIAYSAFGGVRAVAITDLIQFIVLIIAIPLIAHAAFQHIGGFSGIVENTPATHFETLGHYRLEGYVYLFFLNLMPFNLFLPPVVQRLLMVRKKERLSRMMMIYLAIVTCIIGMIMIISISSVKIFGAKIEPENVMINAIATFLPAGFKGLAIAGLIAVIMSTADSMLNSASIMMTLNTFFSRRNTEKKKLRLMKMNALIIGAFAMIISCFNLPIFIFVIYAIFISSSISIAIFMKVIGLRVTKMQFWVMVSCCLGSLVGFKFFSKLESEAIMLFCNLISVFSFIATHLVENKGFFVMDVKKSHTEESKISYCSIFRTLSIPTISLKKIAQYSAAKVDEFGAPYQLFGVFCCANYALPYFMWPIEEFAHQNLVISIRFMAGILCLGLIFSDQWNQRMVRYLPLYWHITIMICLPFYTTVVLFITNATQGWLLNMALMIFFLSTICDWKTFIFLNIVGFCLGFGTCYVLTDGVQLNLETSKVYWVIYAIIFSTFIGTLFSKKRDLLWIDKFKILRMFASIVAHEMRNPLASCKSNADMMCDIVKKRSGSKMEKRDWDTILQLKENMQVSVNRGLRMIDELLMMFKTSVVSTDRGSHSMKKTIIKAIEEMALLDDAKIIHCDFKTDMTYTGSMHYMKHVIGNLISNALKYGTLNRIKDKITIVIDGDILKIIDTGGNIDPNDTQKIFERFYTTNEKGTGIGLAFCKMVVQDTGGQIWCDVQYHKRTTFSIRIPQEPPEAV